MRIPIGSLITISHNNSTYSSPHQYIVLSCDTIIITKSHSSHYPKDSYHNIPNDEAWDIIFTNHIIQSTVFDIGI